MRSTKCELRSASRPDLLPIDEFGGFPDQAKIALLGILAATNVAHGWVSNLVVKLFDGMLRPAQLALEAGHRDLGADIRSADE